MGQNVCNLPFLPVLPLYYFMLCYFILNSWRHYHWIDSSYPKNRRGLTHPKALEDVGSQASSVNTGSPGSREVKE